MDNIEEEIREEDNQSEEREKKVEFNYNKSDSSDKKRNIIVILLIIVALLIIGGILLFTLGKKDNKEKTVDKEKVSTTVKEEKEKKYYVSCDDNTALLNVRNSTSGDIIDGLSCFKEIDVLEEAGSTDTCDKWYRVSYKKRGDSYTGYVCSKYIKESTFDSSLKKSIRSSIDKANKFYEDNQTLVYCGETDGTKTVKIETDGKTFDGQYAKSKFKSLEELKKYVLTFLDESLIKVKFELGDIDNPKMYDNYFEIDGNLYCRNYSGKGWMTYYTGNYDIEIENETDDKITGRIVYEYINDEKLTDDSKCSISNLDSCPNSIFKYELGDFTIVKESGNYVIRDIDFHK